VPEREKLIFMQSSLNRHTNRLKYYDYSSPGAYFISVCTYKRKPKFGEIINSKMIHNSFGKIAEEEWLKTFTLRPYLIIDEYVIMPNHLHAIIWISEPKEGTARRAPTNEFSKPVAKSLSSVIRSYKAAVTKHYTELYIARSEPVWQRGYYEHVIRKVESLDKIRQYIANNPANWAIDKENPFKRKK